MQSFLTSVSRSELVTSADQIFDRYSPYSGDGLRNHCRRLADFALLIMARDGIEMEDKRYCYLEKERPSG